MGKCQLCESCTFERNQVWNSTARLLASWKPPWKPIINHMGSFGGPEANDRVPLAALPRLPHQLPPSSLRSQANKQLEPRQNTSRHTRDPAPSHVDLLHPDLHLPVALDMAQHSNNRRSSGARPPSSPCCETSIAGKSRSINSTPRGFTTRPPHQLLTARPDSGSPDPEWLGDFVFIPSDADAVKTLPFRPQRERRPDHHPRYLLATVLNPN